MKTHTAPKYLLCSGYHRSPPAQAGYDHFFPIWLANVSNLSPQPERIIIICDSGARPPLQDCPPEQACKVTVIPLTGDLGNCHATLNKIKNYDYGGWSGVVLVGALLAYLNETHLVFFEEDVLAYGPVIWKMFEEIEDAGIIFGSTDGQPCAQSLFLLKHDYINTFVRLMLSQGKQDKQEELGEHQFRRLEQQNPDKWKRFSFGFDRSRPINYDDHAWYAQHLTSDEMDELRKRKLI